MSQKLILVCDQCNVEIKAQHEQFAIFVSSNKKEGMIEICGYGHSEYFTDVNFCSIWCLRNFFDSKKANLIDKKLKADEVAGIVPESVAD